MILDQFERCFIQIPPILWVVDESGGIIGLMKVQVERKVLERGFFVTYAVLEHGDPLKNEYTVMHFNVGLWCHRQTRSYWYVLETSHTVEELKKIEYFR